MNVQSSLVAPVSPLHLLWTVPVGIVAFFTGGSIGGGLTAAFVVFVLELRGPLAAFIGDGSFYFWGAFSVQLFRQGLAIRQGRTVKPSFLYRWPVGLGLFFGVVAAMNSIHVATLYRM
jgi:hypothetical protein